MFCVLAVLHYLFLVRLGSLWRKNGDRKEKNEKGKAKEKKRKIKIKVKQKNSCR